jgi:hypothetical protein
MIQTVKRRFDLPLTLLSLPACGQAKAARPEQLELMHLDPPQLVGHLAPEWRAGEFRSTARLRVGPAWVAEAGARRHSERSARETSLRELISAMVFFKKRGWF